MLLKRINRCSCMVIALAGATIAVMLGLFALTRGVLGLQIDSGTAGALAVAFVGLVALIFAVWAYLRVFRPGFRRPAGQRGSGGGKRWYRSEPGEPTLPATSPPAQVTPPPAPPLPASAAPTLRPGAVLPQPPRPPVAGDTPPGLRKATFGPRPSPHKAPTPLSMRDTRPIVRPPKIPPAPPASTMAETQPIKRPVSPFASPPEEPTPPANPYDGLFPPPEPGEEALLRDIFDDDLPTPPKAVVEASERLQPTKPLPDPITSYDHLFPKPDEEDDETSQSAPTMPIQPLPPDLPH